MLSVLSHRWGCSRGPLALVAFILFKFASEPLHKLSISHSLWNPGGCFPFLLPFLWTIKYKYMWQMKEIPLKTESGLNKTCAVGTSASLPSCFVTSIVQSVCFLCKSCILSSLLTVKLRPVNLITLVMFNTVRYFDWELILEPKTPSEVSIFWDSPITDLYYCLICSACWVLTYMQLHTLHIKQ